MSFNFGDEVVIAKGAIDDRKEVRGELVGYDDAHNKFRVKIGSAEALVFPEAITGILSSSGDQLKKIRQALADQQRIFSTDADKAIATTLGRAARDGRTQLTVQEIIEDAKVAQSANLTLPTVRSFCAALPNFIPTTMYNPFTDTLNIEKAHLPLRMLANLRGAKMPDSIFGSLS